MSTRQVIPAFSEKSVRLLYESPPLDAADLADTVQANTSTFARDTSAAGVCVADGMGLSIRVDRSALVVEDGMGPHRRARRFDRATHGLRRLVILGSTGNVSIDALTWCRRLGIGVVVIGPDGAALLASTPRVTDDARIRRTQAMSLGQPVGIDLARSLIADKLAGQARVVSVRFSEGATAATILDLAEALASMETNDEIRQIEASAAALYWQSWVGRDDTVPRFATRDLKRIPAHWTRYEGRRSVLSSGNGNRKAERPTNGILSYVYKLLEVEAILACSAVGLDPGLGLIHADVRGRQSLSLDLIEPVRPAVDAFVLDLLERRTFKKSDFIEISDGHCRLRAPLTHELAETLPQWSKAVAPVAERLAHTFGQAMDGKYVPVTPLTTKRHRSAQAVVKARKQANKAVAESETQLQRPTGLAQSDEWTCPDCGGEVTNRRHVRCEPCIQADPRQTAEIRGRRGAAIAARKRTLREWEESNPNVDYDPELFGREILPRLAEIKLAQIVEAIGCSKGYASVIRSGKQTPHVSTWETLAALVEGRSTGC
jgi:CRISPR-associated endonuclease Cas1